MYSRARTSVRAPVFDSADQRFASQRQAAYNRRQASYSRMRSATPAPPMLLPSRTPEIKFFDTVPSSFNLSVVGSAAGSEPSAFAGLTELNAVTQGAGAYQRIGQKIVIKSVAMKMVLSLTGTPPAQASARFLLIYDRQPNGAFPAITDILSVNVSTAPNHTAGLNMSKKSRFTILADRYYDLDSDGNGQASISLFRNNINLDVEYTANNGLITDISTGALYFLAFSLGSVLNIGNMNARIRFYDQ